MLVAIATVHWPKGFWVTRGGYEFNLTLIASAAAVAIAGPGAYSIDRVFGINLPEPLTLLVGTVALVAGVLITLGTRAPQQAAQINRETA
jgi:putative oxidoreductase